MSKSCEKRGFDGKSSARRAVQSMHQSVRIYQCDSCAKWHITKERYTRQYGDRRGRGRHGRLGD